MPLLVTFLVWCPDGYLHLDARLAAWPHCHVQASSVWWAVPHPAPAFLLALPATLTPASSSHPSCHWDHLQISVLVFCLPERRGYNYPSLPGCLGVWWRYMLRHIRSNQTFLLRLKAMGLGTARRNQGKSSAGMTLILCRKWSGKKICHLKPDWEQPCRNLTGLKWCQLVSDLTHLHFTEHWQTPEAASSREVPASLWGAEHPKPASEAKKVNKSVIQQLISCISIAKERETPFCSKGWPFPSEALISKPHISLCACSPASSEPFQTSWPRTEWSSAAATTGPAFKCGNTSSWRRQAVPQLVSCNFGVIWACLAPGEAEGAHVRCPPHWLCQLN